jgi:periplasmic protein TonB
MIKSIPSVLAVVLALCAAGALAAAPARPKAKPAVPKAPPAEPDTVPRARAFVPAFMRVETIPETMSFDMCKRPEYPKASRRNEETGIVTIHFVVTNRGEISSSGVYRSSGFRDLDRAALNSLNTCKFKPGSIDGEPVQMKTSLQYVWTLE